MNVTNKIAIALLSTFGYLYYTTILTKVNTYLNFDRNRQIIKDKKVKIQDNKSQLVVYSYEKYFNDIIQYIYKNYPDKIKNVSYDEEKIYTYNDWKYRRKNQEHTKVKILTPNECNFEFQYKYLEKEYKIKVELEVVKDHHQNPLKIMETHDCCSSEEILRKLIIESDNNDILVSLIDTAKEDIKKEMQKYKKSSKETMRIYYYKKDFWCLLAKSPKRTSDTIYLPKNKKEELIEKVEDFFSEDTRDIYLSFGIPYKCVYMIHGPPGSGKTSVIKSLASILDCDIFVLPITKDMVDSDFVSAFAYINDQESNDRIIVIEDIDTLFEERKDGDTKNGITLQAFLNCLDGFTCIEGTMLFITANKPEVLDYAFIRSCRIDHKIELGYADKYQSRCMFEKIIPTQKKRFDEFYSLIKHKEYTTAALQEFLFYNRNCENILDLINDFNDIVDKNDPKNFEILKEVNKNFYS
tara:strand:- start:1826 stop:3226 length:1401 start_codon:yes stop_codon:yes gene_type:complete